MVRSRKPKRKASRKKSRSPKRSSKRCPPGCVKRKVARKTSRKRKSAKRKTSRKRKSAKRKVSRKRKSAKRKVSRKRKSAKRKVSRKRKSAKRKVSRKRKSAKRKVSRKRKSAKRKVSRKRKSVKHKFRLSYKKWDQKGYRLPSKKSNNRCDRIAKDYIHKLYKISNTLHDKQKQLGCGVKKRNNKGKYISRYPHSTSLNLQNMLTLMDHLHPIRKKGQRSSRRSYRPPSRRSHRPSSPWGLSHASTRILSRPSSGGSSRPTSRRLSEDFEDPAMLELMESLSTADPVARTPSRIARNDTGIDEFLSTLSDQSQRQELSASNLAEHDRMQMERLASVGIVSSPSTNSRPRTSPAALRSRSGTVQELEDAPTVIMDDRAVTV